MTRTLSSAQHVHGEDGMGAIGLPTPTTACESTRAVDALLSCLREHAGELTLVTLAPSPTSPPPCWAIPSGGRRTGPGPGHDRSEYRAAAVLPAPPEPGRKPRR
ncbi:hypothetical protein [Streptomyces sp. NRRL S-1813]|uniref:hypothetical protein n=1 Tax=Streptomyces sp. NRRL S-1813 TaxID=1463888 RepID=UPI001F18AB43|nr:hypothetical protein [Streptomyces sp. NRRL S-1813]